MRFSIIIPVYNDPDGLAQTISSLREIIYDGAYEIIIVDNNSSDDTLSIATEFGNEKPYINVIVEEKVQSSYAARNRGIKHASGEILAFLDADMIVNSDWLSLLDEFYTSKNAHYVGCDVELYQPKNKNTLFGRYNIAEGFPVQMYIEEMNFAPTCCLSVRREVINDVGMFITHLESGGDKEFGNRVAAAGYPQHFADGITLYHPARISFQEHLSKAMRIGRGREQLYQTTSTQRGRPWYHLRNFMPPHPKRFSSRMSTEIPLQQILIFYIITYFLKLVKITGQIEERFLR